MAASRRFMEGSRRLPLLAMEHYPRVSQVICTVMRDHSCTLTIQFLIHSVRYEGFLMLFSMCWRSTCVVRSKGTQVMWHGVVVPLLRRLEEECVTSFFGVKLSVEWKQKLFEEDDPHGLITNIKRFGISMTPEGTRVRIFSPNNLLWLRPKNFIPPQT